MIDSYPITQDVQSVAKSMFGCLMYKIEAPRSFSFTPGIDKNNDIQLLGSPNPVATFTLLNGVIQKMSPTPTSVAFCLFRNDKLFVRRSSYLQDTNRSSLVVGGHIISSHFGGNISVSNIKNGDEVTMTFNRREVSADVSVLAVLLISEIILGCVRFG